jgi:anti-sigma regulatory factor (Ser/Thr protein kinase)
MTLELHATPEEVMRGVEAVREFARGRGLEEKEIFALALALEECGSNIVNHALQRDGRQMFRIHVQHARGFITIELRDSGPEFDPTIAPPKAEADDDLPGGWGLQLVRRYMDEIDYRREAGENILTLRRKAGARTEGNDLCHRNSQT